ncbi:hypothetical protein ABC733_17270 [Mangrovibacter sp. SLW1]
MSTQNDIQRIAHLGKLVDDAGKTLAFLQSRVDTLTAERDQLIEKNNKLVAENVALKAKGREVLKEASYVYSHYNRMVEHLDGEIIDGQTLHELQEVIELETPVTDAAIADIRAEAKSEALDEMAKTYRDLANEDGCSCNMKSSYNLTAERAENYAAYIRRQLR